MCLVSCGGRVETIILYLLLKRKGLYPKLLEDSWYKPLCVLTCLSVNVSVCCVLFDELTAWFYVVAHEH